MDLSAECRKRRSGVLWGCRVLTRTLGGTLANNYVHLIGVQPGPVNYRRRVSSAGSDGPKASETIWWRRGDPTWLPWFASASGACRAPDDGMGIRASVGGSERANGAVDEPCRSRCVQNSGDFIIWRAAYLRTSAPPKPPATHGRTTVSRTLFCQPRAFAYLLRFNNKKIDKIGSSAKRCGGWARCDHGGLAPSQHLAQGSTCSSAPRLFRKGLVHVAFEHLER